MLQSFSIFYPIQVLLCCFPWLPQIHKNWSFEAQGLRGGTAPHVDTALLKAQINCLTSQRDEALHVLQQLEDFATAVYPAYKSLSLKKLKAKLNVRGDCNSKLYTFYQTTLYLLSDLEKRKETISSLTSEILRFGDTQLEANRDDYYFATKFAGVFRAVEEWVYLKFLDADIEQQLEAGAVNLLRERAGGDWQRWLKEEHLLLLTSVVSEMLVSQVLEPPLLGVVDSFVALIKSAIEKSFLENTDADIKWRAKTIEVLTDSPLFWEAFQPTAYNVFDSILNTFSPLTYKDTQTRTKKLAALIKEGGSVAIECQKEPSQFKFKRFPPGSRCKAKLVSDARNRVKDRMLEREEDKWVVAMTVAPAVLRVSHGSGRVVVVLKAKVVLVERAQESNGISKQLSGSEEEFEGASCSEEEGSNEEGGEESSSEEGGSMGEECSEDGGSRGEEGSEEGDSRREDGGSRGEEGSEEGDSEEGDSEEGDSRREDDGSRGEEGSEEGDSEEGDSRREEGSEEGESRGEEGSEEGAVELEKMSGEETGINSRFA